MTTGRWWAITHRGGGREAIGRVGLTGETRKTPARAQRVQSTPGWNEDQPEAAEVWRFWGHHADPPGRVLGRRVERGRRRGRTLGLDQARCIRWTLLPLQTLCTTRSEEPWWGGGRWSLRGPGPVPGPPGPRLSSEHTERSLDLRLPHVGTGGGSVLLVTLSPSASDLPWVQTPQLLVTLHSP